MNKYAFTHAERYAVWIHHQKRCWRCREPLRLIEISIDHFVPEHLTNDTDAVSRIITHYGLPEDFQINGFENWLPCHRHCNESKGKVFELLPCHDIVFRELIEKAGLVRKTAKSIKENVEKDKLFAVICVALENGRILLGELLSFIADLGNGSFAEAESIEPKLIRLDNGYWLHEDDIAAQGPCQCGRKSCVGSDRTVYCYWARGLSEWVLQKRLCWKCYDEIMTCPRCHSLHPRGHIGKLGSCERPYVDQREQHD